MASPPADWQAPAQVPLLADLLRVAIQARRTAHAGERDRLHADLDALHDAFREQRRRRAARPAT